MKSATERFWRMVDRRSEDECWPWLGYRQVCGHGQFRVSKEVLVGAHRFSYELANGQIPQGMSVCHACDHGWCVNPKHLWLGTHTQNVADMVAKKRHHNTQKTHCRKGHAYTPENTGINSATGGRYCKACDAARPLRRAS